MTKFYAELMPDADMYLFFEKGMSSGCSYVSKRYSKAKNKYLNILLTKTRRTVYYILRRK